VSHQVKALETELAIKLFNRERQRLVITEAGLAASVARTRAVRRDFSTGISILHS
jgi:DNA-binding transcriptional LysR family regulator